MLRHTLLSALPHPLVPATLLALGASAQAQAPPTDLFIVHSEVGMTSSLVQYDSAGAEVHSIDALTTAHFVSAIWTPDGRFVINRGGSSVEIRAYDGTLLQEFDTTYTYGSGNDLAVFDDGTIAICASHHGIMLYSQTGAWVGGWVDPDVETPIGCFHASDDTLWVADSKASDYWAGGVVQYDRAGDILRSFDFDFSASDVVLSGDGTLWVSSLNQGRIVQFTPDGQELASFDVQFDTTQTTLWSLAISATGGIAAVGEFDSTVREYGTTGTVLNEFPITADGRPRYVFTTGGGGVGTRYCFGDGSGRSCPCGNEGGTGEGCANSTGAGAALFAIGSASVSQDNLTCSAENLPAGQPALLFSGENAPGEGDGVVFGDGLRCAGANVARLGIQSSDAAGMATWGPGLAPQAGWSPGDLRYLQVWYRDPNGGPCGLGFNLTNGVEVELYD